MNETSPFLHRDRHVESRLAYRESAEYARDERDRLKGACLLESLRYRWWQRRGTLHVRIIQPLGDFGRKYTWVLAVLVWAYVLWVLIR